MLPVLVAKKPEKLSQKIIFNNFRQKLKSTLFYTKIMFKFCEFNFSYENDFGPKRNKREIDSRVSRKQ